MSDELLVRAMDASLAGSLPFDEQTALDVAAGRRTALRFITPAVSDDAAAGYGVFGGDAVDLEILPELRARGLGRTAAMLLLERAGRGELTAWSHGDHPAARALAARHGFSSTRTLLKLTLRLDDAAAARATENAIAGLEGRPFEAFRPGADDGAWLAVNARAFAGHPEQGSLTQADLAERMAEPWFDPAGFLLSRDADDRIFGFCWTKVEPGSNAGEIYAIGVDPDAAGRGLGRSLLRAGIAYLAGRGITRLELYVEADNAPALGLYRSAAFELAETHVQYRRPALASSSGRRLREQARQPIASPASVTQGQAIRASGRAPAP